MKIMAIVPAWNEAATIEPVVETLLYSGVFEDVLVVDDGSTDRTAWLASRAGATLVQGDHQGKSEAMIRGIEAATKEHERFDAVAFFDADLIGLRRDHCRRLVAPIESGEFDMSCGQRDYGPVGNLIQQFGPLITGERVLTMDIWNALPHKMLHGYSAETVINHTCERLNTRVCVQLLDGLTIRRKEHKFGLVRGAAGYFRMSREIARCNRDLDRMYHDQERLIGV